MADAIFPQARKRSPLFVLMAEDGRFATYDTGVGAYLTPNWALAYSWRTQEEAEARIETFERELGVVLHVESTGDGA